MICGRGKGRTYYALHFAGMILFFFLIFEAKYNFLHKALTYVSLLVYFKKKEIFYRCHHLKMRFKHNSSFLSGNQNVFSYPRFI